MPYRPITSGGTPDWTSPGGVHINGSVLEEAKNSLMAAIDAEFLGVLEPSRHGIDGDYLVDTTVLGPHMSVVSVKRLHRCGALWVVGDVNEQ